MELLLRVYVVLFVLGVVFGAVLMRFLWQGGSYFREMRRELKHQPACVKCGSPATRPGAQFCGKCGGAMLRAA
jgi:rRNA maturation endonuclease Nob1